MLKRMMITPCKGGSNVVDKNQTLPTNLAPEKWVQLKEVKCTSENGAGKVIR